MADVYEKDLGQKSSLTTSDYIRVVGSDNVSYKQLVSDVANKILATRNLGDATTVKEWTPHLYDNDTYVRTMPVAYYIEIGSLVIAWVNWNNPDLSGLNVMLQLRHLPMNAVIGGIAYIASLNGQGAYQTVQMAGAFYLRPNVKSSDFADPTSVGWVSMMLIGYKVL